MWKSPTLTVLFVVILAIASLAAPAVLAQETQDNESDMAFVQRMQARLARVGKRADDLEVYRQQKMGMPTGSSNGIGVSGNGMQAGNISPDRTSRNPVASDFQSMRLKLRSIKKKAKKESERMMVQVREPDGPDGLDRSHIEVGVKRLEFELDEMARDLRRM